MQVSHECPSAQTCSFTAAYVSMAISSFIEAKKKNAPLLIAASIFTKSWGADIS